MSDLDSNRAMKVNLLFSVQHRMSQHCKPLCTKIILNSFKHIESMTLELDTSAIYTIIRTKKVKVLQAS